MRRLTALLFVFAVTASACLGEGNVFSLEQGTCFDDPNGTLVEDVPIVECGEPHDNEVFHLFDLQDGSFPGDFAAAGAAEEGCLAVFPIYVGADYWSSSLDIGYLTPTSESWSQGDREVVCFLYRLDFQPITGSARGRGI